MTAKILVGLTDVYDPEIRAMLMAKYSRDVGPIEDRLPSTEESQKQHKESLGKFYVGYAHKSVGQLAVTDIYFEGVSQLAAKAIENTPLFNGQESSTRYVDFTNQPMISSHSEITVWQEKFRTFYLKAIPLVIEKIKKEFPIEAQPEGTKLNVWENTIKARAFDICRGFLPAGVTTNVGFSGTFDTLNDHFGEMLKHPCAEMREIAINTIKSLGDKYPYATISVEKQMERNSFITNEFFYQDVQLPESVEKQSVSFSYINPNTETVNLKSSLIQRNKFEKLPRFISGATSVKLKGFIDFGSYRDLHRHRPGFLNMPLLDNSFGFNDFYLENLTEELQKEAVNLLFSFDDWCFNSNLSVFEKQYCTPMGYNVPVHYTCDLNQALYILELRSSKTVHQTLRKLVHIWVNEIQSIFGFNFIYADMDEDNFSLKRGTQTFGV